MGWGPLAWERRPRPAAQTPWHARRSCQDAGVGWPARPWPWLSPCAAARDLVFLHKCNYLFPASALAPGAPRVQPQGLLKGLCTPAPRVTLQRGASPHQVHACAQTPAGRLWLPVLSGAPQDQGLPLLATSTAYRAPPLLPPQPPGLRHGFRGTSPGPGPALPALPTSFLPCPAAAPEGAASLGPVSTLPPAGSSRPPHLLLGA